MVPIHKFAHSAQCRKGAIGAFVFWIACLAPLFAQAQSSVVSPLPPQMELVQTVEGITEYKLANGLRILLAPDAADQRVSVNVTYMVGSRHEGYGQTGMAHLLEHLIFKGTPKTPDPKAEFSRRGFNFNGTTSPDRTNYFATFQSDPASLDWYLAWQADAMVNSFIARKDLDSEMSVVRNEYERGENNAVQALIARMVASAYMWHNYGKSTIGAKSDIENVDIASLQAFYRRYYRPDNAFVIVAGKFDPAQTLASVAGAFGTLQAPATPLFNTYTVDTVQDGERSVVVRRPSNTQMLISSYHTPPYLHPDTVPLQILGMALADAPAGRLHKALVESKLTQNVFAVPITRREASTLLLGTSMGNEDEAASRQKILLDVVEGLAAQPITQAEFERAKTKALKNLELAFASATAVANGAIESAVMGDWRSMFVGRDRTARVSLEDVNRVAKTYLVPTNRTLGHLIPTEKPSRSPDPKLADVGSFMDGYVLKSLGESSVEFDYSSANLALRAPISVLGQGIKLSVLDKPVRGDLVTMHMQLHFGALRSLSERGAAAMMVNSMLDRGTPKYTRQQIQDELVRLGAQVNFGLGAQGGQVNVKAKKQQFAQTVDLVMHLLKESHFTAKEFDEIKANWIKTIEGQIQDKLSQANNAFERYANPYPPEDLRYQHTLEEWLSIVKALTLAQVKDFHTRFYGAQAAQVVVVGPLAEMQIKPQILGLLEPWRAAQAWERVPYPLIKKPATRLVFDTPDKTNATLHAQLQLPLTELDIENWQLQMATRMFGGGPGSRLWIRMREKGGLSYSAGAGMGASAYEKRANWAMSSDVAPANLSIAELAMREELARSLKEGFTEEEFKRTRDQWLAERVRSRSGDGYAMGVLHYKLEFDRDWDIALKNDALIASFTLEKIQSVWRKYIDQEQLVWAVFADAAQSK